MRAERRAAILQALLLDDLPQQGPAAQAHRLQLSAAEYAALRGISRAQAQRYGSGRHTAEQWDELRRKYKEERR